jgi:hypothetical protein
LSVYNDAASGVAEAVASLSGGASGRYPYGRRKPALGNG